MVQTNWIPPVSKPNGVTVRISSRHGDERVQDQPQHEEDLEEGEVEFGDAEVAHCQDV